MISSLLYHSRPLCKISSQSVPNFLSYDVHNQTDRQTNSTKNTKSTRRAQTSLAEADHYPHIAHCKNVQPWWWNANSKCFGSLFLPWSGYGTAIVVFYCTHLLILKYLDHHRNLISASLYHPVTPLSPHKILSQSAHKYLSNVVYKQTDRQTNAIKNITFFY